MIAELLRRLWRGFAHPRRDPLPFATRREVWRRDGGRCVRCGSTNDLEYSHVVAWIAGGDDSPGNLRLLCHVHNRAEGPRVPLAHRVKRSAQWLAVGVVLAALSGTALAIAHPLPGAAAIVRAVTGAVAGAVGR